MPATNNPRNRKYTEAAIARALELKLKGTSGPEISKLTGMSLPAVGAYTSPNGRLRSKAEAALKELRDARMIQEVMDPPKPSPMRSPEPRSAPRPPTSDETIEELRRLREEVTYLRKVVAGYWAKEGR